MAADFDLAALRDALDAERTTRGLTWETVGRELGMSASTLRGLGSRPVAEGDGVLRAVTWLRRTPESFVAGHATSSDADVPPGPIRSLRFDARTLYAALDDARAARCLTWRDVATQCGVGQPAALTRWKDGGRVMFPAVMRVFAWLGAPSTQFVRRRR